jgi:hypothetical protein
LIAAKLIMPIDHVAACACKLQIPGSRVATTRNLAGKLEPARVLIAEDDFLIALQIQKALPAASVQVVALAATADEVFL